MHVILICKAHDQIHITGRLHIDTTIMIAITLAANHLNICVLAFVLLIKLIFK